MSNSKSRRKNRRRKVKKEEKTFGKPVKGKQSIDEQKGKGVKNNVGNQQQYTHAQNTQGRER